MAKIWDVIEESGHDFTLVTNLTGTSLYYCEGCATLMYVDNQSLLELFHSPPGSGTLLGKCEPLFQPPPGSEALGKADPRNRLKFKIKAMHDRDHERLKNI